MSLPPFPSAARKATRSLRLLMWDYPRYLSPLRLPLPEHRFAIFGRGRSGSTLLVNLMGSVEGIHCDNEILHRAVPLPHLHVDVCASRCSQPVYGFKLLSYQLKRVQPLSNREQFLRELSDRGYRLIYLTRRNLLYHALSNLHSRQRRQFHHSAERGRFEYRRWHVDVEAVLDWIAGSERLAAYEQRLLQDIPHLALTYEADLQNAACHQHTVDRICDFLDLPSTPASATLVKLMPTRLEDMLENHEELKAALRSSPYERYVSAVG
ncbi:hypothetical protein [Synechococcus sp. PCC 7336]|uniref:hypothetical protein n=1 Tax=Synechococcus sp. PCC 7336 TaxID=195250 RepID=UPI000348D121|nr:hypothetical protein [Synechococcus sp. PCC 7336]